MKILKSITSLFSVFILLLISTMKSQYTKKNQNDVLVKYRLYYDYFI